MTDVQLSELQRATQSPTTKRTEQEGDRGSERRQLTTAKDSVPGASELLRVTTMSAISARQSELSELQRAERPTTKRTEQEGDRGSERRQLRTAKDSVPGASELLRARTQRA